MSYEPSVITSGAKERQLETVRLRAQGLTFVQIGEKLGFFGPAAHKALKKGLALYDQQIVEEVGALRAAEASRLTALHDAYFPAALEGDAQAADIVLKISREYRKLTDIDLVRDPDHGGPAIVINTALPPEVVQAETVDEDGPDELEAGEPS